MLPKSKRLTRAEFAQTKEKKRVFHSPFFLFSVTYSDESKASVVVSKKAAKGAVERNRIRRRVYGVLEDIFPEIKKHAFMVVVVKTAAIPLAHDDLKSELLSLFSEARMV